MQNENQMTFSTAQTCVRSTEKAHEETINSAGKQLEPIAWGIGGLVIAGKSAGEQFASVLAKEKFGKMAAGRLIGVAVGMGIAHLRFGGLVKDMEKARNEFDIEGAFAKCVNKIKENKADVVDAPSNNKKQFP